jgi:acetate kinase
MNILVINTGSSSIKYQLFDMENQRVMVSGLAEKIGEKTSLLEHNVIDKGGQSRTKKEDERISDHRRGLNRIAELLMDPELGVIKDKSEISAVGHRVVHGGEAFKSSTIIDERVIQAVKDNIPLAPLHNPPNLEGIEVSRSIFPDAPQVAVFDTAFHQTIPEKSYLYAIPYEFYTQHKVRRYGFHGTSHAYVAGEAAEYLKTPLAELNLITLHLGNGASISAVQNGRCLDTSMGLTPLEGLVMGTRSGDVDPAIPFFLAKNLHLSLDEIDRILNKESGLKGLCGTNDMREVEDRAASGDEQAQTAVDVYAYRIKKYIGGYFAAMGQCDAVVFTAGIGENSPLIRKRSCENLEALGMEIDEKKNEQRSKAARDISSGRMPVKILVIPTNEEKRIAMETEAVLSQNGKA